MPVAKSFQSLEIICDPYYIDGRQYVKVRNAKGLIRQVRWYSEVEYAKMYGEELPPKKVLTKKEALGFANEYITIFKGNTFPLLDWFKSTGAKYKPLWGWYFPSDMDLPNPLPNGVEPVRLLWENVCNLTGDDLGPKETIEQAVGTLLYEPSNSQFVGEVGDKIMITITVKKKTSFSGPYGPTNLFIMEDLEDNIYTWFTTTNPIQEGKSYILKGSVKDHKIYKNEKQTVLSRCKVLEEI